MLRGGVWELRHEPIFEMVLTAASFHAILFTETDPHLFAPQVSIPKPSFPFKFKASRRKALALGAGPSAFYKPRGFLVARAHFLAQKSEPVGDPTSSPKSRADKSFQNLQSFRDALLPLSHGAEDLPNNQRQTLQRLRGFSAPQMDRQPNKAVGLEQRRHRLFLDPPAHLQSTHTGDLGSSHAERNPPSTPNAITGKSAQPLKRRGSRNSSRGFDVLDDLMSSQGRSSRALLDSLQSEAAFEKDVMLNFGRDSVEGGRTSPVLSRKFPVRNDIARKHGGLSQMIADPGRVQRWQSVYEDMADTASTSSPFASSIEKALSPSVNAKSVSATNTTSSRNASVAHQSIQSLQLEDISDVPQPSLRGQEVVWALQKAAIEKAKQKQKSRKPNDRAVKAKEVTLLHESGEWRNAKPFVLKPEWALQIDDLERRIEILKNPIPSS